LYWSEKGNRSPFKGLSIGIKQVEIILNASDLQSSEVLLHFKQLGNVCISVRLPGALNGAIDEHLRKKPKIRQSHSRHRVGP
jgi:hypothetical protein